MKKNIWAIVPVKGLQAAKTRLAPVLDRVQRVRFTLLMLEDVLEQLKQVEALAGVGVLSDDLKVQTLARQMNVRIWSDHADVLNPGLQAVAGGLAAEGSGIMIVPGDVPAARAQEYRQLLMTHCSTGHRRGLTMVEAIADGGTNALLCDPGVEMKFRFGPGSFKAHVQEAERLHIEITVADVPGLLRDIDRPEDLFWLLATEHDCRAGSFLQRVLAEPRGTDWERTA